jgi:hypothetical protein
MSNDQLMSERHQLCTGDGEGLIFSCLAGPSSGVRLISMGVWRSRTSTGIWCYAPNLFMAMADSAMILLTAS